MPPKIVEWKLFDETTGQLLDQGKGRDSLQFAMSAAVTRLLDEHDGSAQLRVEVAKRHKRPGERIT